MRRKLAALALAVSALTGGVGVVAAPPAVAAAPCATCGPGGGGTHHGPNVAEKVFLNKIATIVAGLRNGTLSQAEAIAAIQAARAELQAALGCGRGCTGNGPPG